ncbi:hypothetical protein PINS_up009251 [Pythium insidiosum]|nr:hypothetical protein PINS_up009251 [Pythium insidiosum]
MSAAQTGEIYCDAFTRDDSKDSIQYQDAEEIPVKGKTAKVKVYRVQHQAQAKTKLDPTALLDSTHHLPYGSEYLVEAVPVFGSGASSRADYRRGLGQQPPHRVLIITGESGTGKTMLLRYFQHHQTRCFMGAGDPVDTALEFHAWSGIVREMLSRTIKTHKTLLHIGGGSSNKSIASAASSAILARGGPTDADLRVRTRPEEVIESFLRLEASRERQSQSQSHRSSNNNNNDSDDNDHERPSPLHDHGGNNNNNILDADSDDHSHSFAFQQLPGAVSPVGASQTSSGRHSPRVAMEVSSMYERVPVLDYLVQRGRIARSMTPILNDLLPHEHLFPDALDTLEKGEERTKALEMLVFSIVEALSRLKPILLIFDNAHWMDSQSWTLLLKVLDELPNVSALIATRAMHRLKRQPLYDALEALPFVKKLEMRRFSYQVTALFLCQHYHIAIMDTQVLDFVFARTDGNPAELIKLMDFMIESKFIAIERETGSIKILNDLDDLDMQVPQYTRAKVMSCIDLLDGLAQLAIKVISINPEPVDERMLSGVLTLFLASEHDDSESELSSTRLKLPRSTSAHSILHQVRVGLAECEKEAILTIDDANKLIFFNSEEMRLVVYDTMLPSQRETIHLLYCQWFKDVTRQARYAAAAAAATGGTGRNSGAASTVEPSTLSGGSIRVDDAPSGGGYHPQYAMLGYHLSRSGNPKAALEAYQKAAEHALEVKDLSFATDCMQSSFKILEDGPRASKLSELDYILVRSKIEFLRGAIAIEKSEWDMAIAHMSFIIRLCQRKGSVLRRYSSSIYHNESVRDSTRTAKTASLRLGSTASIATVTTNLGSQIRMAVSESTWYLETQERCMPKLFNFQRLMPWGYPATLLFRRNGSRRQSRSTFSRMTSNVGRVQPEETVTALNQVNFYRRKAEILIKKIYVSKRKQEEMSREIQRLTQQSLKVKKKR